MVHYIFVPFYCTYLSDEIPPEVQAAFYLIRKRWSYQMR